MCGTPGTVQAPRKWQGWLQVAAAIIGLTFSASKAHTLPVPMSGPQLCSLLPLQEGLVHHILCCASQPGRLRRVDALDFHPQMTRFPGTSQHSRLCTLQGGPTRCLLEPRMRSQTQATLGGGFYPIIWLCPSLLTQDIFSALTFIGLSPVTFTHKGGLFSMSQYPL